MTWEMDGEQYVSVVSGWGGAVPLWGGEVAERYVRFVFSAEPVERLQEIPDRVAGTKLAEAVASRV